MTDPAAEADPEAAQAVLIARIARGDQGALSALIRAFGPTVTRIAQRMLGSAADADEVAQDTFLQVWAQAGRFDPARGTAAAWVFRIATSRALDRGRRLRVRRFLGLGPPAEEMAEVLPDPGPGAARQADARRRLALVRAALLALPERQRMALLLAAVAGLDTAAIAGIMGISGGAAEQLLVRARRGLRDRLPAGADTGWSDDDG